VSYNRVPFHLVANDGNILEHAVPFDGTMDLNADGNMQDHKGQLPTQAIAERYDIVVDFSKNGIKAGDKLYFVNLKEHDTGIGTKRDVPLAAVLSESYKAVLVMKNGLPEKWDKGDPVVGRFLELRVKAYSGTDVSMNPADYEPAKPGKAKGQTMLPLWMHREDAADMAKLQTARRREFEFGKSNGTDEVPWTVKTDGSSGHGADMRRIDVASQLATGPTDAGFSGDGTTEVWTIKTGGGWSHPVHVHFEEGIILRRGGKAPPEWEKWARKDVYRIGSEIDSTESVELAIRFREFAGTYLEHCHNTQHEDNSMLLRWDLERPGQFQVMPTPLPSWEGVEYVNSVALPSARTGSGWGPAPE
jgi:FtsP/CotA-like multicopper oxidase with cupredoxin domain